MDEQTTQATGVLRRRNPRGEGSRLASEIVDGALAIVSRSGSSEAVTLRSVAREVGIAAPSIYAHFPDREAILAAVVERVFDDLRYRIQDAVALVADPVERLVAGTQAYVSFGLEHPGAYGLLFARANLGPDFGSPPQFPFRELPPIGGEGFGLLVDSIRDCVKAGVSTSTDVFADATAVWVALHGTVSLWSSMCAGPWPNGRDFVRGLTLSLARIRPDVSS
jgi:AcrR family transcriptional regulator